MDNTDFSKERHLFGAKAMHALTLAIEAAISRYSNLEVEATAIQIISFVSQSMTYSLGEDEQYSTGLLAEACKQAERLSKRGYGGYAQAIDQAIHRHYSVPAGMAEALLLQELLKAYGKKAESRVADLARKTGLVADDLPDDRTMRLFISWIEQQRVLFELPDSIEVLCTQDFPDIIDDTLDAALHFYPTPVFYDAIDLEQFLVVLLPAPHKKE